MDISDYVNVATGFHQAHPLIAGVCGIFLFYLLYRKPKFFLSVLLLAFILAVTTHFILKPGSSGVSPEEKAIKKGSIHKED